MIKKSLFIGIVMAILGCNGTNDYSQIGGIEYRKGNKLCIDSAKTHWLVDLELKNGNDSTYLNTNNIGRKIEVHTAQLDTNTSLIKLLAKVCTNDSIDLVLNADSFYLAFGGKPPLTLDKSKPIKARLWMRDKLNDLQYLAHKQVFENEGMERFIKKSGWNGQQDSVTDIYFEKLKISDVGVQDFKKVKLKYVIKSIYDNVIAYSKDGDPLIYDTSDKSILRGIQFLANKLAVGESLRAVVPSSYAFGPDGNSQVPGYMPIIIELELLEILE
ncbi:MAG: FKBP-type peptidyl-prolyl cis-trans isomerase [Bacteroidia bacterium]|nr:FKBP-type peptidyl-prolyl cis-trans isomerase [Bacteroidia bacterium]NNJ55086.1 hypothetical protein [Bacteroidia bacterium]